MHKLTNEEISLINKDIKEFIKDTEEETTSDSEKIDTLFAFLDGYTKAMKTMSKIVKLPIIIDDIKIIVELTRMIHEYYGEYHLKEKGIAKNTAEAEKLSLQAWKDITNIAL